MPRDAATRSRVQSASASARAIACRTCTSIPGGRAVNRAAIIRGLGIENVRIALDDSGLEIGVLQKYAVKRLAELHGDPEFLRVRSGTIDAQMREPNLARPRDPGAQGDHGVVGQKGNLLSDLGKRGESVEQKLDAEKMHLPGGVVLQGCADARAEGIHVAHAVIHRLPERGSVVEETVERLHDGRRVLPLGQPQSQIGADSKPRRFSREDSPWTTGRSSARLMQRRRLDARLQQQRLRLAAETPYHLGVAAQEFVADHLAVVRIAQASRTTILAA